MLANLKRLAVFLLILGVVGAVMFFPFNFNDRYTCLYHRLFFTHEPLADLSDHRHVHNEHQQAAAGDQTGQMDEANSLVPYYIKYFAFPWWGSLLILTVCIIIFRRKRRVEPMTHNPQNGKKPDFISNISKEYTGNQNDKII